MSKAVRLPSQRCDECALTKVALGFVTLGSEEGTSSRTLCSRCFNRWYMVRAGLPELETVEFEPITRFDSVGKEHTFYFVVHMSTGLLAQRYLHSSDFPGAGASQNRLYLKGTAVNGRIEEREGTSTVVVDGCEYTWEEFGRFLSSFSGFNFRLECFDACEDPETTPDPERPDPVWWLSEDERIDSEDPRHH